MITSWQLKGALGTWGLDSRSDAPLFRMACTCKVGLAGRLNQNKFIRKNVGVAKIFSWNSYMTCATLIIYDCNMSSFVRISIIYITKLHVTQKEIFWCLLSRSYTPMDWQSSVLMTRTMYELSGMPSYLFIANFLCKISTIFSSFFRGRCSNGQMYTFYFLTITWYRKFLLPNII